jgi:acetoin utilization deacetylase AcuC-like enzyme
MKTILPTGHARHDPDVVLGSGAGERPYFETSGRIGSLLRAARAADLDVVAPHDHGLAPIRAVHDPDYLAFLATAFADWRVQPGREDDPAVRANAFAVRSLNRRPTGVAGLAGWYLAGHGAPVLEHTFAAAVGSAHAAIDAADTVLAGAPAAYALCRPPGHHAYADLAGGFCFINNAAVAAQRVVAAGAGRVGLLDFDVHHGNGTQAIFYGREDVHYVSIHGDPATLYPFYAGYADETGTGAGLGRNLNLPLPPGTSDGPWIEALTHGLKALAAGGAAVLVVSVGFDAHAGDPTANLAVTPAAFHAAGRLIAGMNLPTVLIQEGGYLVDLLETNLGTFLDGFGKGTP